MKEGLCADVCVNGRRGEEGGGGGGVVGRQNSSLQTLHIKFFIIYFFQKWTQMKHLSSHPPETKERSTC